MFDRQSRNRNSSVRHHLVAICTVVLVVSVATGLGVLLQGILSSHRICGVIYLAAVAFVSFRLGLVYAIAACLVSLFAYDYFIIPPVRKLFGEPETVVLFAAVFGVAIFSSWAAQRIHKLEIERLEAALAASKRFLATVSHEVRTPMVGVIGLIELLSLKDLAPEANEMVRTALFSSQRLLQILNSLLEASQLDQSKIQLEYRAFSLRATLGDIGSLISHGARQKGLRILISCDDKIPEYICGDELRVRQILLNLAFNAVKFTEHGEIHIDTKVLEQTNGTYVIRFAVTDTGIGIAPEHQTQLFQPFFQVTDSTTRVLGGAGLGLAISKQLVDLMGGQIGCVSKVGNGSTFWLEIPFLMETCTT